jgi:hypothetical protein
MVRIGQLGAALILGVVVLGGRPAAAQDTSFMDMNMNMGCMLMAGMHEMQLAVYQSGAREDSCEDIPSPGPALISLTAISKELRDMTTEVRLVKDAGTEPAPGTNLDPVTLAYLPPKKYPTGVITFPVTFDKPGKYAVLVTVTDDKDMVMSGRLVMTVGETYKVWVAAFAICGVLLAGVLGFYLWDQNRKKHPVKTA